MPTQTRSFQRRVIDDAKRKGELCQLYWFVEMDLPPSLRPKPHIRNLPASFPAGFVPVVAVAPDPVIQQEWALLLLEIMRSSNRNRGLGLDLALTTVDLLKSFYWYEWGDEIAVEVDHVCPFCGMVWRGRAFDNPVCGCSVRSGPSRFGLCTEVAAYVDGWIYRQTFF